MVLILYIVKFSLGLALVYSFYRLFLSRLTFYHWNRIYLLCAPLICAVLPFIDLQKESIPQSTILNEIPAVEQYFPEILDNKDYFTSQNVLLILFISGCIVCAVRLALQYFSFMKMKRNARLLHQEGSISIYTSESGGAFSFGNEIYLDTDSGHSAEETTRILQHEIIHVKERHWIDLVAGELLCIINWFNPVAWWMRNAIRLNLEYIADQQVIQKGYDAKAYQYLLLKVTGNSALHIAVHFSMTNLKNRIKMINTLKSARVHLAKFALLMPLVLLLLFAFRTARNTTDYLIKTDTVPTNYEIVTVTAEKIIVHDQKGYEKHIIHTGGEEYIFIINKKTKERVTMSMSEWNANKKENEAKYGLLPRPPIPPVPPVPPVPTAPAVAPAAPAAPVPVISAAPDASPAPVVTADPPEPPVAPVAPVAPVKKKKR